ncbi:uncharacterized protein EV420DRAFT_1590260 [Desarmillaria tabescens]|uniref:Uncharacterized protein n=1 Tax=Armillaria tabescens TaxID=1929756 RepID=A0AA39MIU5_ARMTA|nr:uncharacterized protein EV420DRAFT_1590260 [Desarmillaria tabescens]KAK0436486.1 hypothetical protein EV420DRAFT_1590260 [Desarmillaria tabescens]
MARIIRTYASSNLLHATPAQPLKPEIYDRPCTPEPFLPPLRRTDSTETLRATATRNRGRPHRQHSRSRVTLNGHKDEESLYMFPKKRNSSTDTIRAQKLPGKGFNTEDDALENGDDIVVYPCPDDDIPTIPDEDGLPVPILPPRTFLAPKLPLPTHFFGQKLPFSRRADLCSLTSKRLVPERFSLPQKLRVRDVCADDDEPNAEDSGSRRSKTAPTVWDMNASLTFYEKSGQFFDIWDMDDSQVIAIPARMHFILKDPERWDGVPMENTPDIRYIDFRCQSFDYDPLALSKTPPNPNPDLEPNYMQSDFYVDYRGPIAWGKSNGSQGICAFPVWRKTTRVNWFMRKRRCNVRCLPVRKNYEFEFSDGEEEEDWDDAEELMQDGWYLKFMIPIPVSLFRVKQTRAFRAEASAWIGREEGGGVLMADTDFMVSHLRLKEIAKR